MRRRGGSAGPRRRAAAGPSPFGTFPAFSTKRVAKDRRRAYNESRSTMRPGRGPAAEQEVTAWHPSIRCCPGYSAGRKPRRPPRRRRRPRHRRRPSPRPLRSRRSPTGPGPSSSSRRSTRWSACGAYTAGSGRSCPRPGSVSRRGRTCPRTMWKRSWLSSRRSSAPRRSAVSSWPSPSGRRREGPPSPIWTRRRRSSSPGAGSPPGYWSIPRWAEAGSWDGRT